MRFGGFGHHVRLKRVGLGRSLRRHNLISNLTGNKRRRRPALSSSPSRDPNGLQQIEMQILSVVEMSGRMAVFLRLQRQRNFQTEPSAAPTVYVLRDFRGTIFAVCGFLKRIRGLRTVVRCFRATRRMIASGLPTKKPSVITPKRMRSL
jgi:hypothetical protein